MEPFVLCLWEEYWVMTLSRRSTGTVAAITLLVMGAFAVHAPTTSAEEFPEPGTMLVRNDLTYDSTTNSCLGSWRVVYQPYTVDYDRKITTEVTSTCDIIATLYWPDNPVARSYVGGWAVVAGSPTTLNKLEGAINYDLTGCPAQASALPTPGPLWLTSGWGVTPEDCATKLYAHFYENYGPGLESLLIRAEAYGQITCSQDPDATWSSDEPARDRECEIYFGADFTAPDQFPLPPPPEWDPNSAQRMPGVPPGTWETFEIVQP